jgi:hypothetical protein
MIAIKHHHPRKAVTRKRTRARVRGHHHDQGLGFRWSRRLTHDQLKRAPNLRFGVTPLRPSDKPRNSSTSTILGPFCNTCCLRVICTPAQNSVRKHA